MNQYLGKDKMSCSRIQRDASSETKIATSRSQVKHSTTDPPRSGADPGFLERGFICIKVCVWGVTLLILSFFKIKYPMKMN